MTSGIHKTYIASLYVIGITVTLYFAFAGFDYYTTPLSERFWNQDHELMKPAGFVGHGLGVIGSAMMTFGVIIYMLRKRVQRLFRLGLLKHWLEFHIFLCTLGPILIVYHTTFKLGGIVAVSFWCMIAVVLSGVIGRFIYGQIPRTIQGREVDIKELALKEKELTKQIEEHLSEKYISENLGFISDTSRYRNITFLKSINIIFTDHFASRKILRDLKNASVENSDNGEILQAVKNKIILARQVAMLRSMQSLFRNWHVVHLPFAMVMFVIMFVHIIVAIVFGYIWIF